MKTEQEIKDKIQFIEGRIEDAQCEAEGWAEIGSVDAAQKCLRINEARKEAVEALNWVLSSKT